MLATCGSLIDKLPNILKEKYKINCSKNDQCAGGLIFKKKIFNIKANPFIWLKDKDVNPENMSFFHEIKYLF